MLISAKAAAAQNVKRGLIVPTTPPIAGPSTKPKPNALPIMPKAAARFSGGVTSAMYALAVDIFAVAMPESTRPAKSHQRFGASAMIA